MARLYLADGALAARLKALREQVGSWDEELGLSREVAGRDSERDPGRRVDGPREGGREGLAGLVRANMKRAQEAMRVLEELGKIAETPLVPEFKETRFSLYSVEADLLAALARGGAS